MGITAAGPEDIAPTDDAKLPITEEGFSEEEALLNDDKSEVLGIDANDVDEVKQDVKKKPILMAKIENVYHEPFQMTQEVKVCNNDYH